MAAKKPLKLGPVEPEARPVVDVFGLAYRIRALTRSVQHALDKVDKEMRVIMKDDDADGDALVRILGGALDALLAPEGNNARQVGEVVSEKWESDELSIDALRVFVDDLQEQAVEARPT
jgi:hypothetical protein